MTKRQRKNVCELLRQRIALANTRAAECEAANCPKDAAALREDVDALYAALRRLTRAAACTGDAA